MGWISVGGSASYSDTNANSSGYGTRAPVLSDDWTKAFSQYKDQLNPSGANATQQGGINLLNTAATTNATQNRGAMYNTNAALMAGGNSLDTFDTPQANTATVSTSANAPTINAKTGADEMAPYSALYGSAVVDPALADYDAGVGQQYGAFKAGTAGAFGNKRTGVAEANFADAAARGRGTLASNLLTSGLTTAAGLGEQDANRSLSADTSNASNLLSNNQFNANAQTQGSEFNANEADKADQRTLDAVAQQTGINQQMLNNVFTVNGFDMQAAQSLLAAGSITQEQLDSLVQMAGASNGSSYTDNKTSDSTTVGATANAKLG